MSDPRIEYYCGSCGSTDLLWTAAISWNSDTQRFEQGEFMDGPSCQACGAECREETRELT